MASHREEVGQFVMATSALLRGLREDIDLSPSDELLIEGLLICLVDQWLAWQKRRELLH
jgi:hypothetical protein